MIYLLWELKNVMSFILSNCKLNGIFLLKLAPNKEILFLSVFVLALGVLLIQVRENADVKGIVIDKTEMFLPSVCGAVG